MVFILGKYELCTATRELRLKGKRQKVEPLILNLLIFMLHNPERIITRSELVKQVWSSRVISDSALNAAISNARHVIGDSAKKQQSIKTVSGAGYRFVAKFTQQQKSPPPAFDQTLCDSPQHPQVSSSLNSLVPLIGRKDDVKQIVKRLFEVDCRLLNVLGFGGVGKSRLAQEVANQSAIQTFFAEGISFIQLSPVQSHEHIPEEIAKALGLSLQGVNSPLDQLTSLLDKQKRLIILDNVEHLVPHLAFCSALLKNLPQLKIMLTSRIPSQVYGEWQHHLKGLAVQQNFKKSSDASLLFYQAAKRIYYSFEPTPRDREFIEKICLLVNGMPLAIEVAASWLSHLSCKEVYTEVNQYFKHLPTVEDGRPTRTPMTTVLKQTWQQLGKAEQQTLLGLSLFCDEFSAHAAQGVTQLSLKNVNQLIAQSVLNRNENGHYQLHEVMRQYAAKKIKKSPALQKNHYRVRFIEYHLEKVQILDDNILGGQQFPCMKEISQQQANLRQALNLCYRYQHENNTYLELGMRLIGAMSMFWFLSNQWQEGRQWAEKFISLSNLSASASLKQSLPYAQALMASGGLSVLLDEYALGEQRLTASIQIFNTFNYPLQLGRAYTAFSVLRRLQGRYKESIESGEKSARLFEQAGDEEGSQFNLSNLGHAMLEKKDYENAANAFENCILLNKQNGTTFSLPHALVNFGRLNARLGEEKSACKYYKQTIELSNQLGILLYRAQAHTALAWIELENDNTKQAKANFRLGAIDYLQLGEKDDLINALNGLAISSVKQQNFTFALEVFSAAETLASQWGTQIPTDYKQRLKQSKLKITQQLPAAKRRYHNEAGKTVHINKLLSETFAPFG